ncbi:hypothetical protein M3184_10570 [Metabacillus litoralis]|nr:hypothetical protein [Metabacillus litoralis]
MIRCLEIEPALMILKEKSASTSQENVINPKNVEEEINMIAGDLKEDFIM